MSEALLADLTPAQNDLFKKATQATERKNTDFAITLLRQLLSQTPGHIESRRLLRSNEIIKFRAANALSRSMSGMKIAPMTIKGKGLVNKNPVEALDVAENILELDPFHEQGNTILADAGKALGSNDIALLALETVREGDPKNTNNMKRLALLHLEMGDPEKAVQIYDKIIAVTPNDGEAIKGQKDAAAAMAAKAGKWDQEGSFRNQLKNADEARLLEQSAREVTSEEGIDMQLHELYQLFEKDNQNLNAVKKMASLYEKKQDFDTALQWYEYASGLSNHTDPVIQKNIHEIRLRQYDVCIKGYEDAIAAALSPEKEQYIQELEGIKQQRAELELESSRKRAEKYPNDLVYQFEFGEALFKASRFQEAIPVLQKALKQPNVRIKALNMMGLCFWKGEKRMLDFAEKQFRSAAEEIPGMDDLKKEIIYNLGCVLEEAGKNDDSLEQFKEIYDVDMQYKDVAQRVESSY